MRVTLRDIHLCFQPARLDNDFQGEIVCFFNSLRGSALQSLSFFCSGLRSFFRISKWPFTGLSLDALETLRLDMPMTPGVLTECLSRTPSLTTFQYIDHLEGDSAGGALQDLHLSSLTSFPNQPSLMWPLIQNIHIIGIKSPSATESGGSITGKALVAFLASRSQTTLKSCNLLFDQHPSFSREELSALRQFKSNGLKLHICWFNHPSLLQGTNPALDFPNMGLTAMTSADILDRKFTLPFRDAKGELKLIEG